MTSGKPRSVLLVDLDGTLTNPAEGIIGSFRMGLEALGRTPPPAQELSWIIGPPLRQSFADFLAGTADPKEALAVYRARYETIGLFEAFVYDGVPETLAALRALGARLFLCTAKPAVYARRILRHFDLDRYFEGVYGAELDGRFEDKGELIAFLLEQEGLDADDCAMLGDRKHDVVAALKHGIPTIGALWGFGGRDELRNAGAATLCDAPSDVVAAFVALSRVSADGVAWAQ
jgi:phosphoglycolate phosphatase